MRQYFGAAVGWFQKICGTSHLTMGITVFLRWTPHPGIVVIRDDKDDIRVLLYSYYTTITGGGSPKVFLLGSRVALFKQPTITQSKLW